MGSWLIGAGIVLIFAGLLFKAGWLGWVGRLPGDIRVEGEHGGFYFPLTTMLLLSLLLTLIANLLRRF